MHTWKPLRTWAGVLLLCAVAWGCGTQRIRHTVSLHYEGPKSVRLLEPSQGAPTIIVAPFVDLRKQKSWVGLYEWHNLTVELVSKSVPAARAMTDMAKEFLQRGGLRPTPGSWDGEVESLASLEAGYALFGEISHLDFSGRGTFANAKNRGAVVLELRLGSRKEGRILRRTIEVAPDDFQFILFNNRYEHISHMESIIRRAVSKAIRESLTDLIREMAL